MVRESRVGQSAVTKERLEAVQQKLIFAAQQGEIEVDREPTTPAQTGDYPPIADTSNGGGNGMSAISSGGFANDSQNPILQLAVTPETLLKLVNANTKELVITVAERH